MPRVTKTTRRSEIPVRNRKLTRDRREPVWPQWLEPAFERAKVDWEIVGKHCAQGIRVGQNRWISNVFYELTGIRRTSRQVASHLQQRRAWFKKTYGTRIGIDWDEFILSLYAAEDIDDSFFNHDDDDDASPTLIPDSPNESDYDPPMPATPPPGLALPLPMLPFDPTGTFSSDMNAVAANIDALGNSWMPNPTPIDAPVFTPGPAAPAVAAMSWLPNYAPYPEVMNALFPQAAEPATFYNFPAVNAEVGLPYDPQEQWVFVDNPVDLVACWDDGLAF